MLRQKYMTKWTHLAVGGIVIASCVLFSVAALAENAAISSARSAPIVQAGDWVYYVNEDDQYAIYKIPSNGQDKIKICDDYVYSIAVIDDWVYYVNQNNSSAIYKIQTNGQNKTLVTNEKDALGYELSDEWIYVYHIEILDHWIYYSVVGEENYSIFYDEDGNKIEKPDEERVSGLYRIKTDGTQKQKLSNEPMYDFIISNDWIYYGEISRMSLDGNPDPDLDDGVIVSAYQEFDVQDEWVYFRNIVSLHRIRTDGSGYMLVNEEAGFKFFVSGDWIYYNNDYDNKSLYKMRTDGSDVTKMNDYASWAPYLVGDWIYYYNDSLGDYYKIKITGEDEQSAGLLNDLTKATEIDEFISTNEMGNTNGNIVNGGTVAAQGDWIYYSIRDGLYKMKADSTDSVRISRIPANNINVVGEWIYYTNPTDDNLIYKMQTNGKNIQKLGADQSDRIIVADNWIYYAPYDSNSPYHEGNSGLCKMDITGENRTKLTNEYIWEFNVQDDYIYYLISENDFLGTTIYKIKTDGTGKQQLVTCKPPSVDRLGFIQKILVMDDWIYYISDKDDIDGLYRTKTDGTQETQLVLSSTDDSFNIFGDAIYHYDWDSDSSDGIVKMTLDGSNPQKTIRPETYVKNIYYANNWILYEDWSDGNSYYALYKVRLDGTENQLLYILEDDSEP